MKGYVGKLLRIDLSNGTTQEESLPPESELRRFVGGVGLGMKMLWDEVAPHIKRYDPESPLIVLTGPFTGTPVPNSNNTAFMGINVDNEFTAAVGYTHGFFAPMIKFAGYDGLVIKGAAEKPVYFWLRNGLLEITDASELWGKDTHETEELIKKAINEPRASVACIGPAGENRCHGAGIFNDKNHMAGKGSVGALMGSKNLNAIAVYGERGVAIENPRETLEVAKDWQKVIKEESVATRNVGRGGVMRIQNLMADMGILAVKNLTDPAWGVNFGKPLQEEAAKWKQTPVACFNCCIACAYDIEVTTGKYKGYRHSLSGGGEGMEGSAGMVGISDPSTIVYMTEMNDRLGFDSAQTGVIMGMAFELYEKGLITSEDTGGLELTWGNVDAAIQLVNMIARREGFGAVLADGVKEAAQRIGAREALDYAAHVKGGAINMHDWRGSWATLFGQIVAGTGPCHTVISDSFSGEPDLGYPDITERFVIEGKAEETVKHQVIKLFYDSIGLCWFAIVGVPGVTSLISRAFSHIVGWKDFSLDEMLEVGHRIAALQRAFAVRRGYTRADDFDVGARLLEAPSSGPGKGESLGIHLEGLLKEYYNHMKWDVDSGKPTPETLSRLGLDDAIKDVWGTKEAENK